MKKQLITGILTALLSITASAETTNFIKIGTAQHTIGAENGTGYNIGYGITKITNKNILIGIDFNLDSAKINKESLTNYSGDLKVGYSFLNKKLGVYTIGSALQQSFNNLSGYGFGYGVGVNYKIFNNIFIVAEHKTYSMTNKYTDYDYKNTGVYLQYNF